MRTKRYWSALVAAVGVAVVIGSASGCGTGYRSGYYRAPVVHHHVVEHHVYVHHR